MGFARDPRPRFMAMTIPSDLWSDLRAEGLIDPEAPVPTASPGTQGTGVP
jgi:hypothetical protein